MLSKQHYVHLDYFFQETVKSKWAKKGRRKQRQDYETEKQHKRGGRRSPRVMTSCTVRVKDGKRGAGPHRVQCEAGQPATWLWAGGRGGVEPAPGDVSDTPAGLCHHSSLQL